MAKFILWLIRQFGLDTEIVDKLVDVQGRKYAVGYHHRETRSWFNCGTTIEREEMYDDFYRSTRFDRSLVSLKLEYLIQDIIAEYHSHEYADQITTRLLGHAFATPLDSNYIKRTAALTNIVKSHADGWSTNDIQLIVSLLRKRIEE